MQQLEQTDLSGPSGAPGQLDTDARVALRRLVGREDADFRDGQLEAVRALVEDRSRVLVVQRTGWGKSAVYFVATALRRAQGAGPTVIVSPLLALMRDQIAAAADISRRTFFRYFADKEELFFAEDERLLAVIDQTLDRAPDGEPVLAHLAYRRDAGSA